MQVEGEIKSSQAGEKIVEKTSQSKKVKQNYRLDLSAKELAVLNKLLPAGYSLQFQSKIVKRSATGATNKASRSTVSKKKSIDAKLQNQVLFRKYIVQLDPQLNRMPSMRSKKSVNIKYNDQVSDAVFPKYATGYVPAETARRNGYDNLDESLKPCIRILNLLKNSKTSWAFREPVDHIAMGIPNYVQIIKQPMDLSKIQNNLRTGQYVTPTQFHADINKIVRNSYNFNQGNPEFTMVTQEFEQYYFKIIAEPNFDQKSMSVSNEPSKIQKTPTQQPTASSQIKKKKPERQVYSDTITLAQKKQLSINIRKLARQHMKGIIDIVRQEGDNKIKDEFDLEDLKPETIRQLQNYVKSKLMEPTQRASESRPGQNRDGNDESDDFQIESEEDS